MVVKCLETNLCLCRRVELRSGDGERQNSGSQTRRLGQKPAELHFRPPPQQPIGEQVFAAAPERSADLRGRPHHGRQEPASLAGQVTSLFYFRDILFVSLFTDWEFYFKLFYIILHHQEDINSGFGIQASFILLFTLVLFNSEFEALLSHQKNLNQLLFLYLKHLTKQFIVL